MTKAWLLIPFAFFGCNRDCAEVGCTTYVEIAFSPALEAQGSYDIEVDADGEKMSCEVSVPADVDDTCDDLMGIVRGDAASGEGGRGSGDDTIISVGVIGRYDSVQIVVRKDDAKIAEQDITPDYEEVARNGAGCGTCPYAAQELRMD